jgi:uncharacterized protein YuzE
MKLTYHPKYNVAYIALRDKPDQVETINLSEDVKVDLAPDGTIYGIELLNANTQLAGDSGPELVVINQASGESQTLLLATATPS